MKVTVGRGSLRAPAEGTAVAIGTFDGVHLGHRAVIAAAEEEARLEGALSAVLTWDRHPAATLRPDKVPPLLSSPERKAELLEETGADILAVIEFDVAFSHLSPEAFVSSVLVDGLGVRSVHVGGDWRFGHKAAGDVTLLRRLGEEHGFKVAPLELRAIGGAPTTSSRIRAAIADGEMELARSLLGRPYDLDGVVVRGDARGKSLGFPTANLDVDPSMARPPIGIYAGVARVAGEVKPAAVSVGTNPTFETEGRERVEAFILDFDREIYGEQVRLEFWKRLRGEKRFDSPDALIEQMSRDVEATRGAVTVS